MKPEEIFGQEIEVPEIVSSKMDNAMKVIKEDTMYKKTGMKWFSRIAVAAAACFALIAVSGAVKTPVTNQLNLTVMGSELKAGAPVYVTNTGYGDFHSYGITGGDNGTLGYFVDTGFFVEGEDVQSVTYSINEGAFQVVEPADGSIIVSGTEYPGELNVPGFGGIEDENGNFISKTRYYTSFTVAGKAQTAADTWISVCGEKNSDYVYTFTESAEELAAFYQSLVGDVVITCTVEYTDGSTQTADIGLGARTATYGELGIAETAEWENYEDAFIVFEMK